MTNGIFAESPQGHVRHTAASAALTKTPLNNAIKWSTEIQLFSDLRLYEAIDSTRSNTTHPKAPFNIAYDTSDTIWDYQAKDKYLDELFSANMATKFGSAEMTPRHLAMGYDWDKLGWGTVVDVGGGTGHASTAIAGLFPKLHFIIQDLPATIARVKSDISPGLEGRITFQGHDFFTPQKAQADAFFFRYIFHNWADDDVVRIIQNLRPGLRKGTRLLVNEYLGSVDAATNSLEDKIYRERDVQMFALLNAKKRTVNDYRRLVSTAEPRFSFCGQSTAAGCGMILLEWEYCE